MIFTLPFPPTLNHYYSVVNGRKILSRHGRNYKELCRCHIKSPKKPFTGRLIVRVGVIVPDRRKRDLDNLAKPILDVMKANGVYVDDSQIDEFGFLRLGTCQNNGEVRVWVAEQDDKWWSNLREYWIRCILSEDNYDESRPKYVLYIFRKISPFYFLVRKLSTPLGVFFSSFQDIA